MSSKVTTITAVLIIFFSSSSIFAKSPDDRIADLERQLAALQKTYLTNNQDMASAVTKANAIQDEFNAVKGQTEANAHQLKAQHEELMRLITDLQSRTQAIEDRMGIFSSQVTSALGKVAPAAAAEAELYQKALDLANSSKHLEAASVFESFIQKFPKSQYIANAREWIAECFYASRDYKRAIKEFQIFIEKYPKDSKVLEAILKQGNSFYELGLLDEAKAFYEKVISTKPGSPEAGQAKKKIARIEEKKSGASAVPATPAEGESASSYPTETIEQQRQHMNGAPPPATTTTPVEKTKDSKLGDF